MYEPKIIPILTGKAAERFNRMADEAERMAFEHPETRIKRRFTSEQLREMQEWGKWYNEKLSRGEIEVK